MNAIVCFEVSSKQRLLFKNKCVDNTHLAKTLSLLRKERFLILNFYSLQIPVGFGVRCQG